MKFLILIALTLSLYADQCNIANDDFMDNYIEFIKVSSDKKEQCSRMNYNLMQIKRECKFTYRKYKTYKEIKLSTDIQCVRFKNVL